MFAWSLRLRTIGPWVWAARHFLIAVSVIALGLLLCWRPHSPEARIRLTGMALQLLGICAVVWGISETRRFFGRPPLRHQVVGWLRRFPLLRQDVVVGVVGATLEAAGLNAHAHVTYGAGPGAAVDARLEALERNVVAIYQRISQTQSAVETGLRNITDGLRAEDHQRQADAQAILERLDATGTGGLPVAAIGATWVFVGTVLGTASAEPASFLR
jgi:hypothetical protein